jgi:hypothetical protein
MPGLQEAAMRITILNGNPDPGNGAFETYLQALVEAGRTLALTGVFDPVQLRSLAQPERYPRWSVPIFKLLSRTKLLNSYWDRQLQENGVYEQRFARPYE